MTDIIQLPVLGRALDNTALTAYKTCPREYYFSMVLHRRGGAAARASLVYGSLMHTILEWHYKTGGNVQTVEAMATMWWGKNGVEDEADHRTLARGLLDYRRYRTKWGQRPEDESSKTVGYPENPLIELPVEFNLGGFPYTGKIDRIIELGGLYYIEDHKTTSRLDKNYYRSFEMSNQMMGYVRLGQLLMPQLRIVGVRINLLHVLKDATNFERQIFTWAPERLEEWEDVTRQWVARLQAEHWPTEEELAAGAPYPLGNFGMNGCDRKYGTCGYLPVCSTAPRVRLSMLREIPINPWDPREIDDD